MQNTSCTEDRIQHALERCLHGLSGNTDISSNWTAGLCLNYWSLEELVNRDANNYIILAEKTLERTREAQENVEYNLLTPLASMFYFAVLRAPYIPETSDLLPKAFEVFHTFLTWPAPYCHIFREMLSFISEEQRAPGITYQRLVRAEQGIPTRLSCSTTVTVLLLNPAELPSEFLSVAEQLSNAEHPMQQTLVSLIQHLFQASLGAQAHIEELGASLKSRPIEKLQEIYSDLTEAMERATMADIKPGKKRESLKAKLLEVAEKAGLIGGYTGSSSTSRIQPIFMPVAKCYTYSWDQDDFDILNQILLSESHLESLQDEVTEEEEEVDFEEVDDKEDEDGGKSPKQDSLFSKSYVYWNFPSDSKEDTSMSMSSLASHSMTFVSSLSSCVDSGYVEDSDEGSQEILEMGEYPEERANSKLKQKICRLFKTKGHQAKVKLKAEISPCISNPLLSPFPDLSKTIPLRRAGSMYTPQVRRVPVRSKRSKSLPQHALGTQFLEVQLSQKVAFKRRPFLSCDDDTKVSTLRVVVFGSDRISGKVARAYSNLRLKESSCPVLTRFFKLQFYYVPVKRSSTNTPLTNAESPLKSPSPSGRFPLEDAFGDEGSTNDISHYIGILDPWYKRNIMGLMDLSTSMLCQKSSKQENEAAESTTMPILADMVLYYCRFATRSLLLQLYQAEITFDGGRKQTEVFIQCLELGHSAALRAIRASGPGCKRLGIDGDRDVIPFTLQIVYSQSTVSGRSRWSNGEKVCTSVSLRKACNTYEELDSKMECLDLTVREVVKRQNSKTKKSFNQICTSHIKINKAQIIAQHGGTFPLCLDQDERKILQRVIKCEVSPCYKPEDRDFCRRNWLPSWSQASQNQSEFCSLLCLPIATFSGAQP